MLVGLGYAWTKQSYVGGLSKVFLISIFCFPKIIHDSLFNSLTAKISYIFEKIQKKKNCLNMHVLIKASIKVVQNWTSF